MRDVIIYLVCLHELGHALGLPDTSDDADVMWGGGHGNLAVYERQRSRLKARMDLARLSWLSERDVARLKTLYQQKAVP